MKYKIRHTLYCHKNMKSFILVSTDKYNNKISTGSCYNIKEYFTLQQSSFFLFSHFPDLLQRIRGRNYRRTKDESCRVLNIT